MKTALALLALALPAAAQDEARKEVETKLRDMKVTLDFKDAPLDTVVDYLLELSSINIVVDPSVHEKDIQVTIKVKEVSLGGILRLILDGHDCGTLWKDDVLQILPKAAIVERTLKLKIYDCSDILYPIRDFPGVEVELKADGPGVVIPESPREADGEIPIVDLVKAHTGGKSWDENPKTSCELRNGLLVVRQTPEVHARIADLLNMLRGSK